MSQDNIFYNGFLFRESTIRKDEGVDGAILVDSVLLRESTLDYRDTNGGMQKITLESISDDKFLNSLGGIAVFCEHPRQMVDSENFNSSAYKSIGNVVNARLENFEGSNAVVGTLRITDPNLVEEVRAKRINSGSLGYYADVIEENGEKVQKRLRANHFCLTTRPRDSKVVLFNSTPNSVKEKKMDKVEMLSALKEFFNSKKAEDETLVIRKDVFNSFSKALIACVSDKEVAEKLSTLQGEQMLSHFDSILSVKKDIFNSEEETENSNDELESLKKENSELKEELQSLKEKENSCEKEEPKENSESEESKGEEKEEPKENSESEESKAEEKENSVTITTSEVKNSSSDLSAQLASKLNSMF